LETLQQTKILQINTVTEVVKLDCKRFRVELASNANHQNQTVSSLFLTNFLANETEIVNYYFDKTKNQIILFTYSSV